MTDTHMENATILGTTENTHLELPIEKLGIPGALGILEVRPIFNDKEKNKGQDTDRSSRTFKMSARLSKNFELTSDINGAFTEKDGGSYLSIASDALEIKHHRGTFMLKKNNTNEISIIDAELSATCGEHALHLFKTDVHKLVDALSYLYDIPIFIRCIRALDVKYSSTHVEMLTPYQIKAALEGNFDFHEEMSPIYALYREAKNSSSDFYRFLCFYKLLEGLLCHLRSDVRRQAKRQGKELLMVPEEVPNTDSRTLNQYTGMRIKKFFDEVLTKQFRNAVAHLKTDDGKILHVSAPENGSIYNEIAQISEQCVRIVIHQHEALLSQLRSG